ncbi:DinB family protein [Paenibacillus profundus]|uniref:DinB family protein n=1 Tax=Paenibacillus profundus TaxID=1173085 RepID=A0ABS8YIE6_9BACL|nr:DinB family protein [Paenibacillus profundus]MCE5171695.1 DinB family protein [Paenibacillus profundus]
MIKLFQYNWMVREEWFEWCMQLPHEEYIRERVGGVRSFHRTLFHIIDVESSWIRALDGKPDEMPSLEQYDTVERLHSLSKHYRSDVESFAAKWTSEMELKSFSVPWEPDETHTYGEVIRHVIAHEIHHIGQISVWAQEIGSKPVSANFIGRGLNT